MGSGCFPLKDEEMSVSFIISETGQYLPITATFAYKSRVNIAKLATKQTHVRSKVEKKDNVNRDKLEKITIKLPNVLEELKKLSFTGTIMQEHENNFWVIRMNEDWQNKQEVLVEILAMDLKENKDDAYNDSFNKARDLSKVWANQLSAKENSHMKHGFFSPTSKVGFHISLGHFKTPNEPPPPCLVEGTVVSFSIEKFSTSATKRPRPTIVPGQRKFKLPNVAGEANLRHFATQWYQVDIVVNDFNFKFKFPPHISLACYGLMFAPEKAAIVAENYQYGKIKL